MADTLQKIPQALIGQNPSMASPGDFVGDVLGGFTNPHGLLGQAGRLAITLGAFNQGVGPGLAAIDFFSKQDQLEKVHLAEAAANGWTPEQYRMRIGQQVPPGTQTQEYLSSNNRPVLRNPDGSVSTERSITVTDPRMNGGAPTNIPSIWNGQQLSQGQAIQQAVGSGQRFQAFNSIPEAEQAAVARSQSLGGGEVRKRIQFPNTPQELEEQFLHQGRAQRFGQVVGGTANTPESGQLAQGLGLPTTPGENTATTMQGVEQLQQMGVSPETFRQQSQATPHGISTQFTERSMPWLSREEIDSLNLPEGVGKVEIPVPGTDKFLLHFSNTPSGSFYDRALRGAYGPEFAGQMQEALLRRGKGSQKPSAGEQKRQQTLQDISAALPFGMPLEALDKGDLNEMIALVEKKSGLATPGKDVDPLKAKMAQDLKQLPPEAQKSHRERFNELVLKNAASFMAPEVKRLEERGAQKERNSTLKKAANEKQKAPGEVTEGAGARTSPLSSQALAAGFPDVMKQKAVPAPEIQKDSKVIAQKVMKDVQAGRAQVAMRKLAMIINNSGMNRKQQMQLIGKILDDTGLSPQEQIPLLEQISPLVR